MLNREEPIESGVMKGCFSLAFEVVNTPWQVKIVVFLVAMICCEGSED